MRTVVVQPILSYPLICFSARLCVSQQNEREQRICRGNCQSRSPFFFLPLSAEASSTEELVWIPGFLLHFSLDSEKPSQVSLLRNALQRKRTRSPMPKMLALKSCFAGLTCRKFEPDLTPPVDVVDLFRRYCGNKPHMDASDLRRFLTEVQCEADYETPWQAQALMDMACSRKQKGKHAGLFSLDDFFNLYLFNDVLNGPIHAKVNGFLSP
jgi:hypothetical protein